MKPNTCRPARARWLWAAGIVAWIVFSGAGPSAAEPLTNSPQPNIVFILSDDHRWDHLGGLGHPFLKTPHLDRLASEGVHFTNAFVTTSLCSPSRASFLTGQYAHRHGVKNNLTPWNDRQITFLEILKRSGYRTAFIGKWHMPGKLPELTGKAVDRFVTFTTQEGQGQYFDCPLIIDGVKTPRPGKYITTDLTDLAIAFIRRERDRPFCLYLAHKAVHHQFLPPPDLHGMYEKAPLSHLPQEYYSFQVMADGALWEGAFFTLESNYRRYCECIAGLDREIGRLLQELAALGLAQKTVVVYASDNGYSWGEHRRYGKRWATEENIRIPFMIRYPAGTVQPGRRSDVLALNIDLAPTLLDLAGLPVPAGMQGRSLRPILENRDQVLRKSFLYEYFKDYPYNVPEHFGVRTDRHLYVEYEGGRPPALFDIRNDPRTKRNLVSSPEGQKVLPELKQLLEKHKQE
jgi:N-acetylglucosamine-6-sulfatase